MSETTEVVRQTVNNLRGLESELAIAGTPQILIDRLETECQSLMVVVDEDRAMTNRIFSRLQGAGNHKP